MTFSPICRPWDGNTSTSPAITSGHPICRKPSTDCEPCVPHPPTFAKLPDIRVLSAYATISREPLVPANYATHKHAAVRRWLERHPRFHIHFTPTSWLNMVERLFADLTSDLTCRRLRRGCFRSVAELKSAIRRYLTTATPLPNRSFGPKGPTPSFENTNGLNGTLFRGRDTSAGGRPGAGHRPGRQHR